MFGSKRLMLRAQWKDKVNEYRHSKYYIILHNLGIGGAAIWGLRPIVENGLSSRVRKKLNYLQG